jgi:hypothetical protein
MDRTKYDPPPLDGLRALFQNWFEAGGDQAIESILRIENEDWRAVCLLESVHLHADSPNKLLAMHNQLLSGDDARYAFAIGCIERLATSNTESAFALLRSPEMSTYRRDGIESLFKSHAEQSFSNFRDIAALAKNLEEGPDRDLAFKWALGANNLFVELNDYINLKSQTQDPSLHSQAFLIYSKSAIQSRGIDGFFETLEGIDIPEEGRRSAIAGCLKYLANVDGLENALTTIQSSALVKTGRDEGAVTTVLLSNWPPDVAIRYVASLEDGNPQKEVGAEYVADKLVHKDANVAAQWIAGLPVGPVRDRALRPLLRYLAEHHEEESLRRWKGLESTSP